MAAVIQEDETPPPVPNWLLHLEEQRAKRLKVKLGHEAGAGARCQICGDKCPGLDLHFWRKICKICKCGKEDHDISDEDIYGFVQFTLLGSKPVKTRGILLKGCKDEVILEFTPKGSSTDVKKYLDELPEDLVPVKGSEAAKLRKQRLQKQMPAHDIDPTLCHALTDEEIKQLEEYVAFIRKHSVGQGSIIRLPLYKGSQHTLNKANVKLISQATPKANEIASSQSVFLQASELSNNLQNLSFRGNPTPNNPNSSGLLPQNPETTTNIIEDNQIPIQIDYPTKGQHVNYRNESNKNSFLPNCIPKSQNQIVDNQNPTGTKITDINYPLGYAASVVGQNPTEGNVVHPLTTTNVEKHQEQYENPNFEINNANLVYKPNLGYVPTEDHQLPVQLGTDITYPTDNANLGQFSYNHGIPPPINEKTHPNFNQNNNDDYSTNSRIKALVPQDGISPVNDRQVPMFGGLLKDLNYPTNQNISGENTISHKPKIPVMQAQNLINPLETHQNLTSVGLLQDITYPNNISDTNSNLPAQECHECALKITEGGVAVTAERSKNLWHPKCFNCHTCKQPLADLLYFYHKDTDHIYCGRDYAILKGIPRCAACDELIFVHEYCLAEESTFHVKHFCCFECDQPLAGKSYLMENNQPVCLECYENLKAETCQDCKKVIRPEEQGVCLQDVHWHATSNCFVCKKCRKPLLGEKMLLRKDNLFCSDFCFKNY